MKLVRRLSRQWSLLVLYSGIVVSAATLLYPAAHAQTQAPAQGSEQSVPTIAITAADLGLTAARAEAFVEAFDRGLDYLPGEVVVKFKPGMAPVRQQRALNALRSRPDVGALRWVGEVAILRDDLQPNARILAQQLSEQTEVLYAEPNYIQRSPSSRPLSSEPFGTGPGTAVTPNDSDYALRQWNFGAIDLPRAWDIAPGGNADLIVAVVDSGMNTFTGNLVAPLWTGTQIQNFAMPLTVHPDFDASRIVGSRDFVFVPAGTTAIDTVGHGTHVASTIAQTTDNANALAGIAYKVKVMPLKVCLGYWEIQITRSLNGIPGFAPLGSGGCPSAEVAAAIRHAADSGAKVINVSLGGNTQSIAQRDAIAYAVGRGAFVAISAGNEFEDGNPIRFPASFAADINGAMAVAAVGRSLTRAYYSSTGSYTEIAAPGGNSRDGAAQSGMIWQTTLRPGDVSELLIVPRFDRFENVAYQGTSMASPHVAGVAALLMSRIPSLTPAQVESLLRSTARDLGAAGRDNDFGFGLIQPRAALFGLGIRK
jgi:serine protease